MSHHEQVRILYSFEIHFPSYFYPQGFENARTWLDDVREHADPNLTCILVGNKVDLVETGARSREVTAEQGEAWAKENELLFVEASAKSGLNVELAFFAASKDILDKVKRGVFDQGKVRPLFRQEIDSRSPFLPF